MIRCDGFRHARSARLALALLMVTTVMVVCIAPCRAQGTGTPVTTVSAASYAPVVAPDSIVSAFGVGLATESKVAPLPLPTTLAGTTLRVNGEAAPLFYVSPGQINYLIPSGTPPGTATVTVTAGDGKVSTGTVQIAPAAPALFTANSFGTGPLAALLFRLKANGQGTYEQLLAQYKDGQYVSLPIDLGEQTDRLFLILYLTGVRSAAKEDVRVVIGGVESVIGNDGYVGPAPGFAGLDQINVELPRSFSGRGKIELLVKAIGSGGSNSGELEIASSAAANALIQITGLSASTVLASEVLEISGTGFAANPRENQVQIVAADGVTTKAEVLGLNGDKLRVRVPFGAGTGNLRVSRGQSEASAPINMRTSISGFVETTNRQPLANVTVRLTGTNISATTGAEGSFVLPDVTAGAGALVEIDGASTQASPPYPQITLKLFVVNAGRDNQFKQPMTLQQGTVSSLVGADFSAEASIQAGNLVFDLPPGATVQCPGSNCTLSLAQVAGSRTPENLPRKHFSSVIAQITPFGAKFTPGGKLTLPNTDNLPASTQATLFKFDQTAGSATLGAFIAMGTATVSADGQRVETAVNAITEGSYYFVSIERPLAAINGRVVENDGRAVPRAIVRARGQSTFTDGFGGFVLRDVPVLKATGDKVKVEVSYQRPTGRVSRKDSAEVELTAGTLATIKAEIVLDPATTNAPPVIIAPLSLSLNAGETRDFDVSALDPDSSQPIQVTASGTATAFTTLSSQGQGVYRLHLTPGANGAGSFTLSLTATDAANESTSQSIAVAVNQADANKPVARSQAVTTLEDTAKQITLTGTDPGGKALSYTVVTQPLRGSLSGTAPNLIYTPAKDYNGADSFTFKVSNGSAESSVAVVFIAVSPVNDAPVLTVPGPQSVNAGATLKLVVSATDVDEGQTLTFTTTNLPTGATFTQVSATSWQMSWTPTFAQAGTYTVTFKVTDNGTPALSQSKDVQITNGVLWAKTSLEGGQINFLFKTGKYVFMGGNGGILRSADDGRTWVETNQGLVGELITYSMAAVGNTLFAGTYFGGMHRSTDNGDTWVPINNGLPALPLAYPFITSMGVSGTTVFCSTASGTVYRSTDLGNNWTNISTGLPQESLEQMLVTETSLFVTTQSKGVYRAGLEGNNWVPARTGLPQNADGSYVRVRSLAAGNGFLYAGTFGGGAYRSSNNGDSWTAISTGLASNIVHALVVKGTTVYAGTYGDGVYRLGSNDTWGHIGKGLTDSLVLALDFTGSTMFAGGTRDGIFRSTDQGENFVSANSGVNQQQIEGIYSNGQTLLVAGQSGGLFRSTNNGDSWTLSAGGLGRDFFHDLVGIGTTIFACARTSAGGTPVYRSTDLGLNWTPASKGITSNEIHSLLVAGNTLYAVGAGGVFRSTDLGQNWTSLSNTLSNYDIYCLAINGTTLFLGTYSKNLDGSAGPGLLRSTDGGVTWNSFGVDGIWFTGLAVIGNTLYTADAYGRVFRTIDNGNHFTAAAGVGLGSSGISKMIVSGTTIFIGTFGGGVFRSEDGGDHWAKFDAGLKGQRILALAQFGNTLFAGSLSGVFRATPNIQSWAAINSGLATNFVNAVTVSGDSLYVGTLGSGVFRSSDQGRNWASASVGLPPNANVQTVVISGANLFAGLFGDGVYRSTDQGASWAASVGPTNKFINKLFVSGSTIYAGTDGGVFKSINGGTTWTAINTGLSTLRVVSLTASAGTIYAGTDGGGVFRLNADGASWTPASHGLTYPEVTALAVNGGVIYAGTNGGGIFLSRDGGANWTSVNNNLPPTLNVFAFAVSGQRVYAGSVYGVFVTEDEGQTWKQINAGLLETYVSGLAVSGDQLYASTLRGGVFISQIPAPGDIFLTAQDCSNQASLRSIESVVPTTIEFINSSSQTRKVYWLNYAGQLVLYNTLSAGQRYVQGTYLTQPWVVTDAANQCLGIYLPLSDPAQVLIK